jgi:NADH-quinone oxidoreductase subunit E
VAGEKPDYGPQNSRHTSEPEGGAQSLTTDAIFNQESKLKALPHATQKAKILYHAGGTKPRVTKAAKPKAKPKAKPDPKKARASSYGKASKVPAAKPKVLYTDGPTDGAPDDLKVIKGIGPVFERELNEKGIYYYRQIGAWKVADVKMIVADVLTKFPGRIKRDEWVKQGKVLAKKAAS